MIRRIMRWLRVPAAILGGLFALVLIHQGELWWTGNFRTVVPGELYRSAQLSSTQLRAHVETAGIQTIVNLRGSPPGAKWHAAEQAVAAEMNVRLVDFAMSAREILPPERAKALVAVLRASPKPILIHCLSGSDRTGLVSEIYASQVAGLDEGVAEAQITIRYGHFGIPYLSRTYAMDQSWEALEVVFGINGS